MTAMTNLNIPGLAQTDDVAAYMGAVGAAARAAARELARADSAAKDAALRAIAAALRQDAAALLAANAEDVTAARSAGLRAGCTTRRAYPREDRPPAPSIRSPRRRRFGVDHVGQQ